MIDIPVCEYGCNRPAIYYKLPSDRIPNGRYMCATSPNSCPTKRAKTTGQNNPAKQPHIRNKISAVNKRLFAGDSEFRNKCKSTLLERYGVDNPAKIQGVASQIVEKRRLNDNYRAPRNCWTTTAREKRFNTNITSGLWIPADKKSKFQQFEKEVDLLTEHSYRKYKHIINPLNLTRGRVKGSYQLDHKLSKVSGYLQNISPALLSHPANLQMLPISINISKGSKSDLTKLELYYLIEQFSP